ncbi:hypothetical protein [Salmonella phage vB_SenM-S16]|uniref:Uncharacterized 8.8 kDa protein in frd-Gp32 intergenic region n=1 Tax=Salmonella phage S16 TaxID=1087482 RepID=M1EBA8_BPS16|nr:hypothetical protein I133_gp031 [Salmonella phage vB_SenM-S16]AEO97163.1 hypothetical protein [Salmonella phage vB_SenM-S16]WDR21900.1 hypothetical protein PJM34_0232 [Salmonella phage vB_SenM_UTK0003]
MASVDIDVVDFEYIEEVIRNRYPELRIANSQNSKSWNINVVINGPLKAINRFMEIEYCEGMEPEDKMFYMGLIKE